jgi:N-acetylneuraminic acid mutarotase
MSSYEDLTAQEPELTNVAPPPPPPKRTLKWWLIGLAVVIVAGANIYGAWRIFGSGPDAPEQQTVLTPTTWKALRGEAPTPRTEVAAAELKGMLYVIGGFRADGSTADTVEFFDPTTEAWSQAPQLPSGVHHSTAVTYKDKLYVIGGLTGEDFKATSSVYVFDGKSWSEVAALPQPIGAHGAAVLNGRIYVVGGVDASNQSLNKVFSYDPAKDIWQAEAPMNAPRNHLAVAAAAGKLYAVAGRNDDTSTLTLTEVYDPASKKWSKVADLPTGRSGIAAAVVQGRIYVFGGESNEKTFDEAEVFAPTTGKWSSAPAMLESRHGLGAVTFNNSVYVFLGGPEPGLTVSGNIQVLQFAER